MTANRKGISAKVWILVYWHPASSDSGGGEVLGVWAYASKKAAQKYAGKLMLHHIEVVHNDAPSEAPLSVVEAATNHLKAGEFDALKKLHDNLGTGYQLDIHHKDVRN